MSVLPDGNGGFTACPEVLTEDEAIRYLRLDGAPNPSRTLKYYRERGVLRATSIGRRLLYRRVELDGFIERQTAGNGRRH